MRSAASVKPTVGDERRGCTVGGFRPGGADDEGRYLFEAASCGVHRLGVGPGGEGGHLSGVTWAGLHGGFGAR